MNKFFEFRGDWEELKLAWNTTIKLSRDAMKDFYLIYMCGYPGAIFTTRTKKLFSPDTYAEGFLHTGPTYIKERFLDYSQTLESYVERNTIKDSEDSFLKFKKRLYGLEEKSIGNLIRLLFYNIAHFDVEPYMTTFSYPHEPIHSVSKLHSLNNGILLFISEVDMAVKTFFEEKLSKLEDIFYQELEKTVGEHHG